MTPRCRVCLGSDRPLLICVEVGGLHQRTFLHPTTAHGGKCWSAGAQSRAVERIGALDEPTPEERQALAERMTGHVAPHAVTVTSTEPHPLDLPWRNGRLVGHEDDSRVWRTREDRDAA